MNRGHRNDCHCFDCSNDRAHFAKVKQTMAREAEDERIRSIARKVICEELAKALLLAVNADIQEAKQADSGNTSDARSASQEMKED